LAFSCRKRIAKRVKMPTILCAQRSAGTAGWAGRWVEYGIPIGKNGRPYGTEQRRVWARRAAGMQQVNR